ncbi:MAG: hypothetical protein Q9162_002779 [Coniocarpon cinnabarinum]
MNPSYGSGGDTPEQRAVVPQAAIFDLKTRSARKKGDNFLSEQLPHLWLTQAPNFILAFHQWGSFTDIKIIKAEEVSNWESTNGPIFCAFAALLKKIIVAAWQSPRGLLEVEYKGKEEHSLNIREVGEGVSVLPQDMKLRWNLQLCNSGRKWEAGSRNRMYLQRQLKVALEAFYLFIERLEQKGHAYQQELTLQNSKFRNSRTCSAVSKTLPPQGPAMMLMRIANILH